MYNYYKRSSVSTWTDWRDGPATSGSITSTISVTGMAETISYDFKMVVEDEFGNTATSVTTVSTAKVLMSYNKDIGVGIGKIHERGALDVSGKLYINGEDYDFPDFHAATLVNGYKSHAWASTKVGYYKAAGVVHIIGSIQQEGTASSGSTIFTLPIGFRPRNSLIFYAHHGTHRVDVHPSGNVVWNNSDAFSGGNWRALSQISFPADS